MLDVSEALDKDIQELKAAKGAAKAEGGAAPLGPRVSPSEPVVGRVRHWTMGGKRGPPLRPSLAGPGPQSVGVWAVHRREGGGAPRVTTGVRRWRCPTWPTDRAGARCMGPVGPRAIREEVWDIARKKV